jgi:tetratricopeptide (TPR) repeat protein
MARSGARRKQRPKQQSRTIVPRAPRRTQPQSIEDTLFFPKLIRSAKWMFVFLALVFAAGFVVFGVGSGQGTGLGDILQGDFGGSSGGPSVSKAREKVRKNPSDALAQRQLAEALVNDGRQAEAIGAYEQYLQLRPKDVDAKRTLAGLYLTRANNARLQYDQVRAQAEARGLGGLFGPPQDSAFGRGLRGRIDQEFETQINQQLNSAATTLQSSYSRASTIYQQIVATHPDDEALLQLQLGDAAYQARRIPLAIKAYQRFLKLAPDDTNAEYARQQIRTLKAAASSPQPG